MFDQAAINTLIANISSGAKKLGVFQQVLTHEPKSAPTHDVTLAFWVTDIHPSTKFSGLTQTAGVVTFTARIYVSFLSKPEDQVDPKLMAAASTLINEFSNDFSFGGSVIEVDLLGIEGTALSAQTGYVNIDSKVFRVANITIPVVIDNLWVQGGSVAGAGTPNSTLSVNFLTVTNTATITDLVTSNIASIFPSGDTTGATDTPAIQALLNAGGTVTLANGTYFLNAPLTIPPYTALTGPANTSQVSQTFSGAVLKITSGFTGKTITDGGSVTLKAGILLLGQTFGGYSTVSEEQKIYNIFIDGTSAPASVHGIQSYGRLQRVQMEKLLISKVTGDGVIHSLDVAGNQPDGWTVNKVFVRFNTGNGFNIRSADSTWTHCLTSNTGAIGWFINTTSNSKYIGCRSEHSGTLGFGYVSVNNTNSSGGVLFDGCSTDQSTQYGFQLGGTINGVANSQPVPVNLTGCSFRRDGANGGTGGGNFAGLFLNGYTAQVTVTGMGVFPGVNDDGTGTNSPQFGLSIVSSSRLNIGASHIHAATTIVNDDSSNTISQAAVTGATGTTNSPVYNNSPTL